MEEEDASIQQIYFLALGGRPVVVSQAPSESAHKKMYPHVVEVRQILVSVPRSRRWAREGRSEREKSVYRRVLFEVLDTQCDVVVIGPLPPDTRMIHGMCSCFVLTAAYISSSDITLFRNIGDYFSRSGFGLGIVRFSTR